MRRHVNYANIVATLALFFAMTGGALAAKHYLINSTKQINPKVLKKLSKAGLAERGSGNTWLVTAGAGQIKAARKGKTK